jgi:hypothetical protein
MRLKKSIVKIGRNTYNVIGFNYRPPKDKIITENRMQLIQILSRDNSTYPKIDELIENVKKTVSLLKDNNLLAVIRFSNPGQYKVVVKEGLRREEDSKNQSGELKSAGNSGFLQEDAKEPEGLIEINSPGSILIHITKKALKTCKDDLKIKLSTKTSNKFYIVYPSSERSQFTINGENYNFSKIKGNLTDKDIENLLYGLAYEEYAKGDNSKALDIITTTLKDKYLAKLIFEAFTANERQRCRDILLSAALNKKANIQPKVWAEVRKLEGNLSEQEFDDKGHSIMELLKVFEKNGDKFIPLPSENYKRIGKQVVDYYNAFKVDNSTKFTGDFRNLVFTKDKLNISVRYEIPGVVVVNPRQARAVGFKTNIFNAKMFREQTIIRDGKINIDRFQALVSRATLSHLSGIGLKNLYTEAHINDYSFPGYTLISLDISKLPVVNRGYVLREDSLDYLLETCYEQKAAECRQKVLKYLLENQCRSLSYENIHYTKEQYELLTSFGLNPDGIYEGIDNKPAGESGEPYEYRIFEFGIKGFSTMPKVEEVMGKIRIGSKSLNGPETLMSDYIMHLEKNRYTCCHKQLNRLLEEQKVIIKRCTRSLAEIKLAKALTGGWWQGLELDFRGNYLYASRDKTLVIKVVKRTVEV